MAWRCRCRWPGVKSEMRSSMPATPVRAASSGANFACTSRSSCAFWLLLGIQSRDAGCGAGAAWEQAKRRVAEAARWKRMGGAVYPPEHLKQPSREAGAGAMPERPLVAGFLPLLDRLPVGGGRLRGRPLSQQDHDVRRVLPELRRGAHAHADADDLGIADDRRLFRELERVRLHAAELVHRRERLVERRFDFGDALLGNLAALLGHLAGIGLRELLELRILRHPACPRVAAPALDGLVQVRLHLGGVGWGKLL